MQECASDEGAVAAGFSDVDAIDQWPVLSGATVQLQRTELWVDTHVCRLWLWSSIPRLDRQKRPI
tara:strand:- start:1262 stop:1456 length:195 start_codon:yes stop_codon:yes gene_type:complete